MNRSSASVEAVRRACIRAAEQAFEDALMQGLCCEGAWEYAVDAMQQAELTSTMNIQTKRIYDAAEEADGYRVLIDGMWPRGMKKEDAQIDRWLKAVAPSSDLRKWFNHDPDKWGDFKKQYFDELKQHKDELHQLLDEAGEGPMTLLYSARDEQYNNAAALRDYLNHMKTQ